MTLEEKKERLAKKQAEREAKKNSTDAAGYGKKILATLVLIWIISVLFMLPDHKKETTTTKTYIPKEDTTSKRHTTPIEVVMNSPWDGSVSQVEDYLKSHLNDPDSYQSITWYKVIKKGNGNFIVLHKYRAKNTFGGYVVKFQKFILNHNGVVIEVQDR